MRAHEILKHMRRQPFTPFRVHITDGASHEVRHPEMIVVTRTEIAIALGHATAFPKR